MAQNSLPAATIVGSISPDQSEVLLNAHLNPEEAERVLHGIGATAMPGEYAVVVGDDGAGNNVAQRFVALDKADIGTHIKETSHGRLGLPTPSEGLAGLADQAAEKMADFADGKITLGEVTGGTAATAGAREEQTPVPQAIKAVPFDAGREAMRQMSISAADRKNREDAGLPPRTHDLT